ncbi:hypothetical protein M3Y97_00694900 [Aphelenchoides bicaudatus]|nr:hypothetical protein M3Y97_00694900 [Aphelenchoides bicaudatus]
MYYECPPKSEDLTVNGADLVNRVSPISETGSDRFDGTAQLKEPPTIGFGHILYDFEGRYDDELSIQEGFSVRVVQIYDEWIMCWDPVTEKTGIVPSSYLQIFLDEEDDLDTNGENGETFSESTTPTYSGWYDPTAQDQQKQAIYSEVPNGSMYYSEVPSLESSHPPLPKELYSSLPASRSNNSLSSYSHPPLPQIYPPLPKNDTTTSLPQYYWPSDSSQDATNTISRDSGNLSMSSANTAEAQQKEAETNLDDFMELFGLKPQQESSQKKPSNGNFSAFSAPPRPPLPTSRPTLIQPMRIAPDRPISRSITSNSVNSDDWKEKFSKVVAELLNSEIAYLNELNLWEKCIRESNRLGEHQKTILTNGLPVLRDLSQFLVRSIAEQVDRPAEHQTFSKIFMENRDKINKAYASYFRSIEEISQIVENKKDTNTYEALKICLQQMRDSGVFVFDVPTAVVRPIQRSMKYPLFLAELLKLLPITHIDHPKLLEAKKQMDNLVLKMNESKRRKELTKKYDSQENSILDKLSKLNVHSIQKKTNRFRYRFATSVGLIHRNDPDFCLLMSEVTSAERRLCKFIYNVQVYKMRITFMTKKYIKVATIHTKKLPGQAVEALRWEFNAYLKMLSVFLQNHQQLIENEIDVPCRVLSKNGCAKLIEKRCDKLADYEMARALQKLSFDEQERLRCEFEALNVHLKNNLPKVWNTMNEQVSSLAQKITELDDQFFSRVKSYLDAMPEKLNVFTYPTFAKFVDPSNQRLFNLRKHSKAVKVTQQQQLKLALHG